MIIDSYPRERALPREEYAAFAVERVATAIRMAALQADRNTFDPWAAATQLGVDVRVAPPTVPYSGQLHISGSTVTIELRAGESHVRQRFTLCHELAHVAFRDAAVFVGSGFSVQVAASRQDRREERLCDRIAGTLLMPPSPFKRVARQLFVRAMKAPGDRELIELAEYFQVSARAAFARLTELRLWSVRRRVLRHQLSARRVTSASPLSITSR